MSKFYYLLVALVLYCFLFLSTAVIAQTPATDSVVYNGAIKNVENFSNRSLGGQSDLYNGPAYKFPDRNIKGDAFFLHNYPDAGMLNYNGIVYKNIPILYDLYKDLVIAKNSSNTDYFSFVNEKLAAFSLFGHTFIRIVADTISAPSIKTGFYDRLYAGKVWILSKRVKIIQNALGDQNLTLTFEEHTSYFIRKNNIYYNIKDESGILNVLNDKKKEVQQYIKANKIRYKKDPELALVKIAVYYDQLTN